MPKQNKTKQNFLYWVLIFIAVVAAANFFYTPQTALKTQKISFSELSKQAKDGTIKEIQFRGQEARGTLKDGTSFESYVPYLPPESDLLPSLEQNGTTVSAVPPTQESSFFLDIFISWFPLLLFIGVWIFFARQMSVGNGKAMSFGKSRARLLGGKGQVTFQDVAGIDESKEELTEIVDYLKEPAKFQRLGGKIPKGVLLVGAPGTGKTLLAKAIAGEAKVPFFTISGSDFVEMFVGVGASRVRDMFEQAKKNAPCIVFIDEIDAVGRHRGAGLGGGNDEREQTLNQLLVEMDGFETNSGIILIAATNRPDVLDPALLRPGRFDRQVVVPNPDVKGREAILKVHTKKVPLSPDVDISVLARGTPGFSGADLANLVNEGALLAARRNQLKVTMQDLEDAKDKVLMGSERRSMVMDDDEKKMTAYHEAGHAICSLHLPEADPLHKVTIIPRGRALGVTMQLPEKDKYSVSQTALKTRLSILFGGRVAEEIIFGKEHVSTGASNDIQVASKIARRMVTQWGMSDKLGPISYDEPDEEVFLGYSLAKRKNIADETALQIDEEIKQVITQAYEKTRAILTDNKKELELLAQSLVEYETLSGDEIGRLLSGETLFKKKQRKKKARPTVPATSAFVEKDNKKGDASANEGKKEPSDGITHQKNNKTKAEKAGSPRRKRKEKQTP
jgi:cell division protease FtsH